MSDVREWIGLIPSGPEFCGWIRRARVSPRIHLANSHMQLEILGEPGERFTIQASSNLADWVTIGTGTPNAEGIVTFEDAYAGRYPVRHYRAISQ